MKLAALFVLALPALQAQTPVIRTESRLVLVDAVVTDKQGRPLGDLAAKDFRLWEDGREQRVQSASFGAGRPPSSYVVLFFDDATLDVAAGARARAAAVKFVDANAAPGHWVAVADFDGRLRTTQNFTGDTGRLKRILVETQPIPGNAGQGPGQVRQAIGRAGALGQMTESGERNLSALGLALREMARNLSTVPGRKTVLLFSSGVFVNQASAALEPAIGMFNRWNVSLYPVDAGEADLPAPFYGLAKNTGGFVSNNSQDLDRELERLRNEKDGYYTLSYVPAETPDGSCHTLRVKTGRAAADVRARTLYCNVKTVDLLAGRPAAKELESRVTGDQPGNLAASVQVPFFYTEPNLAMLHMAMEIPAAGIRFETVKGKFHGEVQILAIAYQPDGVEGARFSDTIKLDFAKQEEVNTFVRQPLHYEGQFEMASGRYALKVVLAAGGESFGKLEVPLEIEPYDGSRLMLGGLALSKEVRAAADPDTQLLEGVAPLMFQNLRLVPSGDNWFRRGEAAAIYGEVYEALPASGSAAPVEVRLRLVDMASGTAVPAGISKVEAFRPGKFAAIPFALKLNSASLPPGRYRAEVEAGSAGATVTRSLSFEVR